MVKVGKRVGMSAKREIRGGAFIIECRIYW